MIPTVPFSASLAAELARREAQDLAHRQERIDRAQSYLRRAVPLTESRIVDVLQPFDGDDGRVWVKVPARRELLLR
jgi:hypothetical protein